VKPCFLQERVDDVTKSDHELLDRAGLFEALFLEVFTNHGLPPLPLQIFSPFLTFPLVKQLLTRHLLIIPFPLSPAPQHPCTPAPLHPCTPAPLSDLRSPISNNVLKDTPQKANS
jgi:hypothetical protein